MTRTHGSSAAALLAILACALPAGSAQAAHRENVAQATIEQDGGRAFDFAWDISHQRGGVVDHANKAHAAARCTDCEATAIAFQIVLVSERPSTVAPTNEARRAQPRVHPLRGRRRGAPVRARRRRPGAPHQRGPCASSRDVRRTCARSRRATRRSTSSTRPSRRRRPASEECSTPSSCSQSNPSEEADVIDAQLAQDADQG